HRTSASSMRASGRIKPLKRSTGFATIWENGKIHFSILNMLPMVSSKTPVGNLLTCCLVCLSVLLGLIAFLVSSQITGIDQDFRVTSSQEFMQSTSFQLKNLTGRF
ncbi:hypothetical protein PanWU01x14_351350, partial [Parasponia andersonii]